MILPDLLLTSRQNLVAHESGIDSLNDCRYRHHYEQYPHKVEYHYNSRGFRDREWPVDLVNATWCVGDSFTVGIGCPYAHTWPQQLEQLTNQRSISISLDGASNDWISRRAVQILETIQPKRMVIQWSFIERYEDPDATKTDEERRRHANRTAVDHIVTADRFIQSVTNVEKARGSTQVIHSFIPQYTLIRSSKSLWGSVKDQSWPGLPTLADPQIVNELKDIGVHNELVAAINLENLLSQITYIPEIEQLDYARDGHHYDILTAKKFASDVVSKLSSN